MSTKKELTVTQAKEILALEPKEFTMEKLVDLFGVIMGQQTEPKYNTYDTMTVPSGAICPGIPAQPIRSTVGRYIFNKLCLPEKFLKKFGYQNDAFEKKALGKIEGKMGEMILNDELTTKEYAAYLDKAEWIGMGTSYFLNPTLDYEFTYPIKEVIQRRDELFDKYRDRIEKGDNAVADTIESELLKLAQSKIESKGNEGYDLYKSGIGAFGNNYKKTSIFGGAVQNPYTKKIDLVKSNYIDGVSLEDFPKLANLSLIGGYSRGVNTQQSGYERKKLDGASQGIMLDEPGSDCGTKFTVELVIPQNKDIIAMFHYRYIVENGKLVLLTPENINKYVGKTIHLRSPMFCKSDKICNKCAGELFYKLGIRNAGLLSDTMAGTLMNKSMKKMHDASIKFNKIEISKYIEKH